MKNIHILSTDQPTGIFETNSGLQFSIMNKVRHGEFKGFHIYITSDEEIKSGDWIENNGKIYKCTATDNFYVTVYEKNKYAGSFDTYTCKKIILSTDPTLIADGVQAIDDEFLEWFVKNPSCEFVEVQKRYSEFTIEPFVGYKITIPQEEPKQYPMGGFAPGNYWHKECVTCKKEFMGDKRAVQCESCAIELTKQFTQKEPKQEKGLALLLKKQERMYSEEDLRQAFRDGQSNMHYSDNFGLDSSLTEQQWFENFKKK
jgi:hypothetical protein